MSKTRKQEPMTVAMREALKNARAARRELTDADTPPVSTFPGEQPKPIPGQLRLPVGMGEAK